MTNKLPRFEQLLSKGILKIALASFILIFTILIITKPIIVNNLAEGYLGNLADFVASDATYVVLVDDEVSTQAYVRDLVKFPWIVKAAIGDVYSVSPDAQHNGLLEEADHPFYAHNILLKPANVGESYDGKLLSLVLDASVLTATVNRGYGFLAFALMITITLIFFYGRIFTKKATRSLSNINEQLSLFNEDNQPTPNFQAPDSVEIESLQLALTAAYGRSRLYQTTLEQTVEARTLALKNAMEANRIAEEIRNHLVLNLSHDLRTPLTSNIGYLNHVIAKMEADDTDIDNYIDVIKKAKRHALLLANEVDTLTQYSISVDIDSLLMSEDINVKRFISDGIKRSDQLCVSSNNSISFIYSGDESMVTSARLLQFVIDNLLSNAHKYCNNGKVEIKSLISNGRLQLTVKDTGSGIDASELGKIFNNNYQSSSNSRTTAGIGIGLSLTKLWVELLGGTIVVESELGEWTEFRVVLLSLESGETS